MSHSTARPSASAGRDLSNIKNEVLRPLLGKDRSYSNKENKSLVFCPNEAAVVSAEIQQKEDAAISIPLEARLEALDLRKQNFPPRPDYVKGAVVKIRTNYFEVRVNPNAHIFRYTVTVSNLPSNQYRKKKRIIELLLESPVLVRARPAIATDFAGLIVTAQKLQLERTRDGKDLQRFNVLYKDEDKSAARTGAPQYSVDVESDGVVSLGALVNYLNSPFNPGTFDKNAAITALNVVLTWTASRNPNLFSGAKNTKFYPLTGGEEVEIGPGIVAVKGYYASVRTSVGRLLVNVNVCTSAFVRDGRVDLIMKLFSGAPPAEAFLTKRRITTEYMPSKSFKVIRGFAKNKAAYLNANSAIIPDKKISVAEYFRNQHRNGQPLISPLLPLLDLGTVRIGGEEVPIWVPPEECRLVPGQPYGQKLTGQQTTSMLEFAALPPAENARRIVSEGGRTLKLNLGNQNLFNFGLKVDNSMIVVNGRKLEKPGIQYGQKKLQALNGSWNLKGVAFTKAGDISNWSYLQVIMPLEQPAQRRAAAAETIKEFRNVMGVHGFKIPSCKGDPNGFSVSLNNDWDQIDRQIHAVLTTVKQHSVTVLLVILDKEDAYVYSRVKFFADLHFGIHTVLVVGAKFLKKGPVPSAQYIANLALKFNLKLGGINHSLSPDRLGFLLKRSTMVVGVDVTHPSPGQIKNGPSIAAVVASVDRHLAQWPCSLRTQQGQYKGADEIIQATNFGPMIVERLEMWKKNNNGSLPERILVYRDGVSESQYEQVLKTEVPVIYQACERTGSKSTLVAFVIVGKRHHTRFYPTSVKDSDDSYKKEGLGGNANANPQPGTVVDRGITMENGWDFFLQAHDPLKGTAKPAHYVVLKNDFKDMGAKILETTTHDLCYLFGRATRSISVCPPARYADLACERGKFYLYKHLTVRPDRSNEQDTYDPSTSPWVESIHDGQGKQPLIESMFYI